MVKSIADRIRDLPNTCGNLNGELERYESSRMNCSSVRKALNNLGIYSEALTQERAKLAQTIMGALKELKFGPYKNPMPENEQLKAVLQSRGEHSSVAEKIRSYITTNTGLTQKANAENAGTMFSAKSGTLHDILNKYLDVVVESHKTINAFLEKQQEAEKLEIFTSLEAAQGKVKDITATLENIKKEQPSEEERLAIEEMQKGLRDAKEITGDIFRLAQDSNEILTIEFNV
ncbi:MAG: hypothetical protein K940chlam7_01774 [Chlamydiae bacterium]|nr:hypothetical protein [Chlamydiota bacterium]